MVEGITANDILMLPVAWRKVSDGLWIAHIRGAECFLRMNNFPDEPLYTIKAGDTSIDVDDAPPAWKIER